jgi:hypothetical protein
MTDSLLHPATKREHHHPIFSTLLVSRVVDSREFSVVPRVVVVIDDDGGTDGTAWPADSSDRVER